MIETRPAFGFDFAFEREIDVTLAAEAEFRSDEFGGTGAHPGADIVLVDDQILAVIAFAADKQMNVRVVGVPVIDGDPFEPGAKIVFHRPDQVAGEGADIGQLAAILRRDNEAEMVPVVGAASREAVAIGFIVVGIEQLGVATVAGDSIALQIGKMPR